jgi:hypothetical protein
MCRESSVSVLTAALLAALGMVPIAARAATIMATTTGDSGAGSDCTLRQAIQSMNTGAVAGTGCLVASGSFGTGDAVQFSTAAFPAGGANTITLAGGELVISTDLAIDATANGNVTIDANNASRVMDDNAPSGAALTLTHLTLRNGKADYGGGIHTKTVDITLNSSTLSGNSTTSGTFTTGGGIYAYGTNITLNDSTVGGNSAMYGGGGIYDDGGSSNFTVTLNNSTVSGNSAKNGGGIDAKVANAYAAKVKLNNSTVSGNSATSNGGGIYVYQGKVYLTNSTLSANSAVGASAYGGGLAIEKGDSSAVSSYNTIFATNSAATGSDVAVFFTSGLTITGNNNLQFSSGPIILHNASFANAPLTGDPMLTPLAHFGGPTKTRFPLAGSKAVDVISAAACKAVTDQRGYARPDVGSASATPCDIGAVEADAATRNDIIFINGVDP